METRIAPKGVTGYPFDGYDGTDESFDALVGNTGTVYPLDAPGRPETGWPPQRGHDIAPALQGPTVSPRVNRADTPGREDGKVRCGCESPRCARRHGPGGCDTLKASGSKTCRACYLSNLGSEARKFEPQEHGAMLARLLTAAGRRALEEDPGQGLAMLLETLGRVEDLVKVTGTQLLAQYLSEFPDDGLSAMATDLSIATGQPWSKQRVWKRWGGGRNG